MLAETNLNSLEVKIFKVLIDSRKVHSSPRDNIWGVDLVDMQFINKFNKKFCFLKILLMFIVNMYRFFLWNIKKGIKFTNGFWKILDESNLKHANYGKIKTASFTINKWNRGCKIII